MLRVRSDVTFIGILSIYAIGRIHTAVGRRLVNLIADTCRYAEDRQKVEQEPVSTSPHNTTPEVVPSIPVNSIKTRIEMDQ